MATSSSRREFLTRFIKPVAEAAGSVGGSPASLPEGVNILLKNESCIAWGRGVCNRCEEACPEDAIFFVGMMNPRLLEPRCTWCGLCVPVCPVDAIVIRPEAIPDLEAEGT